MGHGLRGREERCSPEKVDIQHRKSNGNHPEHLPVFRQERPVPDWRVIGCTGWVLLDEFLWITNLWEVVIHSRRCRTPFSAAISAPKNIRRLFLQMLSE